jgi:hypothetical protein
MGADDADGAGLDWIHAYRCCPLSHSQKRYQFEVYILSNPAQSVKTVASLQKKEAAGYAASSTLFQINQNSLKWKGVGIISTSFSSIISILS